MNHQPDQPVTTSSNRNRYAIAGVIGFVMLVAIGFLAYSNVQKSQRLDMAYSEINEAHTLQSELESSVNSAIAELETKKGENAEMNTLIEKQQQELEAKKSEISLLLKDKSQLQKARKEIAGMKSQLEGYLAQIEQMKAENEALTTSNQQLATEKEELSTNLQTKLEENSQLSEARAMLVSQNEELNKSVKVGSVVKVKDVKVEGLKIRSNGKVKDKSSAKKVDQLKICFNTVTNEVVQPGNEEFFVRIINPRGETLAMEDLGSGMVTNEKTGEEVRFTQSASTAYNNDEQHLCLNWGPSGKFAAGKYTVEIYNKGYLAGTGGFELK